MSDITLHCSDYDVSVLNEMLERTTRGVAQTAKEIERQRAQLVTRPNTNPADASTRQVRINAQIAHLQEIHAYQERALRTLRRVLTQEV